METFLPFPNRLLRRFRQETTRAIILHLYLILRSIFHTNVSPGPHAGMGAFLLLLRTTPPSATLFPLILNASNNIEPLTSRKQHEGSETRKISRLSASRRTKGAAERGENGNFSLSNFSVSSCDVPFYWADTLVHTLLISAARSAGFPLAPLLPFIGSFFLPRHSGSHRPAESLTPE